MASNPFSGAAICLSLSAVSWRQTMRFQEIRGEIYPVENSSLKDCQNAGECKKNPSWTDLDSSRPSPQRLSNLLRNSLCFRVKLAFDFIVLCCLLLAASSCTLECEGIPSTAASKTNSFCLPAWLLSRWNNIISTAWKTQQTRVWLP